MLTEEIWADYDLDRFKDSMQTLFPEYGISFDKLLEQVMSGDVLGALAGLMEEVITHMSLSASGMKNIFVWLVVLGVASAIMTHFIDIFDKHQIADLGFYFVYLLLSVVLLRCMSDVLATAGRAVGDIVLFVRLLMPAYLIALGLAAGTATVTAYSQLLVLLIYGVEKLLEGVLLPLIYGRGLLIMLNGIWSDEKLTLVIELLEKAVSWVLKTSIGIVTGISVFQAVITPVVDSVKSSALQKTLSAIPGIGNVAEGAVELVMGSAVVIKNSLGVVLLVLIVVLCAAPLLQILVMALLLKGAAAFMGVVSGKRITACVNRTGDVCMQIFQTTGTAMVLFMITLSVVATTTNRGF